MKKLTLVLAVALGAFLTGKQARATFTCSDAAVNTPDFSGVYDSTWTLTDGGVLHMQVNMVAGGGTPGWLDVVISPPEECCQSGWNVPAWAQANGNSVFMWTTGGSLGAPQFWKLEQAASANGLALTGQYDTGNAHTPTGLTFTAIMRPPGLNGRTGLGAPIRCPSGNGADYASTQTPWNINWPYYLNGALNVATGTTWLTIQNSSGPYAWGTMLSPSNRQPYPIFLTTYANDAGVMMFTEAPAGDGQGGPWIFDLTNPGAPTSTGFASGNEYLGDFHSLVDGVPHFKFTMSR